MTTNNNDNDIDLVGAFTIGMYFKSLPIGCQTRIILDSDDLTEDLKERTKMAEQRFDPAM
jgi:hypothetical protein